MTDLASIKTRVEEAKGPDRDLDVATCIALQYVGPFATRPANVMQDGHDADWLWYDHDGEPCTDRAPALTASIDDALALAERVSLDNHDALDIVLQAIAKMVAGRSYDAKKPLQDQLARAIIAALLSALSQKDTHNG